MEKSIGAVFFALKYPDKGSFLLERGKNDYNNSSLGAHLNDFITNDSMKGEEEFLKIILIIGLFFDLDETGTKGFADAFDFMKKNNSELSTEYFEVARLVLLLYIFLKVLNLPTWPQLPAQPA